MFPGVETLGAAALGGLTGGTKQNTNVSQSSNVSVAASPVIGIAFGAGGSAPTSSGGATGNATSPLTAQQPGETYGLSPRQGTSVPLSPSSSSLDVQRSAAAGGLFSDPLVLIALAAGAFLLLRQR